MRELLKKETTFNWTPENTKELENLKTALISKPILGAIDDLFQCNDKKSTKLAILCLRNAGISDDLAAF